MNFESVNRYFKIHIYCEVVKFKIFNEELTSRNMNITNYINFQVTSKIKLIK